MAKKIFRMRIREKCRDYKQRHLRQGRTRPTAYQAQTPARVARYGPENGVHAVCRQGH